MKLFSICLGLALGLLGTEAAVRVYLHLNAKQPSWSDRPKFYFAADGNNTLQDYAYSPKKAPGVFRVAVLGDSYAFAPYMQFTDTFPKKLETMLNLNREGLRAEVINYGVPAYSTSHEVATVEKALMEEADLVLLQITLNDPELKPYRPTGISANSGDRFGELKPRGRQAVLFRYWKTAELVARRIHNTHTKRAYKNYFLGLFKHKATRYNFRSSLRALVKRCHAANKPIAGIIFPLFGLPLDEDYPFHPIHRQAADLLTRYGAPYLDLFDLYAGIPLDRLQVIPVKDRHPNEIAHRMAAEAIYVWLMRQKLLPPELRLPAAYQTRLGTRNQPRYVDTEIVQPGQR